MSSGRRPIVEASAQPGLTSLTAAVFSALFVVAALAAVPAAAQDPETPEARDPESPTGTFTEQVTVEVVNVEVVVTDRSGAPIAGLGRDDFELRLDGEVIPITNFYAESAASRGGLVDRPSAEIPERDTSFRTLEEVEADPAHRSHVVLMIDHTRLRANNRKRAFAALREALDRLGDDALVSVVGVEGSLVFYSDFLFDRDAVHRILDDVTSISTATDLNEMERRQIFGELSRGQSGGLQARASQADDYLLQSRIRAYATQEYERSRRSIRQIETVIATLAGVPGRKTLLYLGEGIPTRPGEGLFVEWRNRFGSGSPNADIGLRRIDFNTDYERLVGRYDLTPQMESLADAANSAGVTLYAVDAEQSHGGEVRSALTEQGATSETLSVVDENYRVPLEYATKATGGRLLQSSGKLADQLLEMVGGLRTFYSLGFAPPDDWQAGSKHDLEVKVRDKSLRVRHREQIRLPEPDEREAGATIAALMYQTVDNPLDVRATPGFETPRDDGTAALPINLEIPIEKIVFLPRDDTMASSLTIFVSTKDAEGNASRVQKIPFHLAIPGEMMERASADSAHYPLPLVLRQGDQQVAIGVRDNVSGLFSAIRLDISQYSRF